jgi:competence protein ComEC
MFQRPLIPLLLAFAGGILAFHFPADDLRYLILPIFLVLTALLSLYLVWKPRGRHVLLLALFFSLGALLQLLTFNPSHLRALALQQKKVVLEGTLIAPPSIHKNTGRLVILAEKLFLGRAPVLTGEKLMVTIYGQTPCLAPGQRIRFPARLKPFRNFGNPGAFDYVSSMNNKGFVCSATVSDGRTIVPMGPGRMPFPYGVLEKSRKPIRQFIRANLGSEEAALFQALILGERQDIDPSLREPFSQTGLGHILAVSGLHIGLVAWAAFLLFKWLLMRSYRLTLAFDIRKLAALLACIPVIFYACLAGLQVSTQRAMIMALVFFASVILDREKDIWSTLAFAALIVLSLDPQALFSISFQLSFGAVLGILWLTSPLARHMGGAARDQGGIKGTTMLLGRHFLGLAAICLAAQVFLLPIIVLYFHRVSGVALFANLMTIPILGLWIIPTGLFSALVLPLSPHLARLILQLGATGLHGMMGIIRFWSQLPFASFWMVTPSPLEIALFYAILFCIFFIRSRSWISKALVVLCGLFMLDAAYWTYQVEFRRDLRVTFLDVGQGNSALVQFPGGRRMVIDGGGFPGSGFSC